MTTKPTTSPARDEGERTNDYADLCERLGAVSALCRRDSRNTVALTLDEAASAIRALAALSPAQTGGTAERLEYDGALRDFNRMRDDGSLPAAPVAEGAREDVERIVRDAVAAAAVRGSRRRVFTLADIVAATTDAILQALDTGTNRGGGPG